MSRPLCSLIGFGPGLGTAYAETFRDAGYDLALLSRSGGGIEAAEGRVIPLACDAADPETVKTALTKAHDEIGRSTDVLIYNAGLATFGTWEDVDETALDQSMRVSALGLYAAARHLVPDMIARGSGTIIVTGATASLRGAKWTTAFAPGKAAQRILAQSLAKQLGPKASTSSSRRTCSILARQSAVN